MSVARADLSALSIEELRALKKHWYEVARRDGSLIAIGRVVRELGTRHPKKHGANWNWEREGVSIFLDDWTGATHASVGERLVYARDAITELFVPGAWMDVVRAADVDAIARIEARDAAAAEDRRQALLRQLGGS